MIYVPVYQPDQVYYQTGYGAPYISFGIGFAIGPWLDCDFDWGNHNIIVWDTTIRVQPTGGMNRRASGSSHATVWHPDYHPGTVATVIMRRPGLDAVSPVTTPVVAHGGPVGVRFSVTATHTGSGGAARSAGKPIFDAGHPIRAASR